MTGRRATFGGSQRREVVRRGWGVERDALRLRPEDRAAEPAGGENADERERCETGLRTLYFVHAKTSIVRYPITKSIRTRG